MKKIIFFLFALLSLSISAQIRPLQCDTVIQEPGKNVDKLYPIIRAWVASTFNSAQDVIQMDDSDNGIMICKGCFDYVAPKGMLYRYADGVIHFTLKVQVRDGRYKVTVSNFIHESTQVNGRNYWSAGSITTSEKYVGSGDKDRRWKKIWPSLKLSCLMQYMTFVKSISNATSSNVILDNEDDW